MAISAPTTVGQVLTSAYVNNNINSGLVYVSTTSLTASGQNIAGAFSSTYTNYLIVINSLVASATNTSISFRLGSSTTRTEYKWAGYNVNVGSGVMASDTGASVTAAQIGYSKGVDGQDTSYIFQLQNPQLATRKTYSSTWSNGQFSGTTSGVDSLQSAQTDINIICGSGTITGGTVTIYGYRIA
jgi:hypothetical protein